MNPTLKAMLSAAAILGVFSVVGIGLVALVHSGTAERIEKNQRRALLENLQDLLPAKSYDNDILHDAIEATAPEPGMKPMTVYRARKEGKPVAAVLAPVAPDGYSGEIRLLVAVKTDGTVAGVRALVHKETPGLGDFIDENKSRWIFSFDGLSLGNPPLSQWKVKRDGGSFDQLAGATVTPRAVVKTVRKTLEFFEKKKNYLFAEKAQ